MALTSGTGLDQLAERSRRVIGAPGPAGSKESLAGRIRAFVGAMPGIDTMRHELKQQLVHQFSRPQELGMAPAQPVDQVRQAEVPKKAPER